MATSDHKVAEEVQHEDVACICHEMGMGPGSGRLLPLYSERLTG